MRRDSVAPPTAIVTNAAFQTIPTRLRFRSPLLHPRGRRRQFAKARAVRLREAAEMGEAGVECDLGHADAVVGVAGLQSFARLVQPDRFQIRHRGDLAKIAEA